MSNSGAHAKAHAKAHADTSHAGLQKVFFACFTDRGEAAIEDIERVVPAHKKWIAEQEAAGKIFLAGPFLDEDYKYSASGLLVFRAETADEARQLAEQDPMHSSGIRTFRIVPWQLNEGTVRVEVNFLQGTFDFS